MCRRVRAGRRSARRGWPDCRRRVSASRRCAPAWPASAPRPADTSDGIGEIVCAATPVNNARASSPSSVAPRRACPGRAAAGRPARRRSDRSASNACRRAATRPRRRCRVRPAGPADAATTRRRRARRRCGRDRGSRSRRAGPAADWRRRSRAPPAARRGRAGRTRRRTATPAPAGAPPSRCRGATPGNSGSGEGARTAAQRRLGLEHLHRQAGPGADDGGRQAVGSAADDGDVHLAIQAH